MVVAMVPGSAWEAQGAIQSSRPPSLPPAKSRHFLGGQSDASERKSAVSWVLMLDWPCPQPSASCRGWNARPEWVAALSVLELRVHASEL